jgi:hypothetical protein
MFVCRGSDGVVNEVGSVGWVGGGQGERRRGRREQYVEEEIEQQLTARLLQTCKHLPDILQGPMSVCAAEGYSPSESSSSESPSDSASSSSAAEKV